MGAEGPWQLWFFVLGWPAVWAALATFPLRRWPEAVRVAAWAGWAGTLGALVWMVLKPPSPLWVWRPGGAGGEALAFILRADPLGLALAAACGGLGLLVSLAEGEAAERIGGALVPLPGMLLAFLGGNLFTYSMGVLLWELAWAVGPAGEKGPRAGRGFPGGAGLLLVLLAAAPADAGLRFGAEEWPGWVRAGTALAGLWIAGVYPAVGPAEAGAALPKGLRALAWIGQPALGLLSAGRVWAAGPVPGAGLLTPLLLLGALFAALRAGEASLARLAATRAALLGLGMCLAPGAVWALPWAVLGFGLGLFLLEEGSLPGPSGRLLDAGWARALGILCLAGLPLTPAFLWHGAGGLSPTFLWWLSLGNALALAPYVWEGPSPAWQLSRLRWREGGACAALVALGALALALGPRPGWREGAWASASALGGIAGAVALAWLWHEVPLAARGARGAAQAVDPSAWAQGAGRVAEGAGEALRWALGLWEGRAALLWGMALVWVVVVALGR